MKELQMVLHDSDLGQSINDTFQLVKIARHWLVLATCTFLE